MSRFFTTFLLFTCLVTSASAQTDAGVFAIIGFQDQELVYVNQNAGNSYPLGELAPTAYALRIHQDKLFVVNGDDWGTGEGSGMWVANLDHLTEIAHNGGTVNWDIVDLADGYNAYDLAGDGDFVYLTLQNGNGLVKLDVTDNYVQAGIVFGLNMPQGIAISNGIICVAESGLGSGSQVTFFNTDLESATPVTIGLNPQTVTVDQDGNFHVVCTGDYGDITGEAWRIEPTFDNPEITSIALGGTPGINVAMRDGNGNEKIVCGDEYAANPPYLYAYDSTDMIVDEGVPVNRSGGWSLAAGNNGVYIGSAISNSIYYNAYDWSGYQSMFAFDSAVASMVYYAMPSTSVSEQAQLSPATFTLSPVWPNPFNANASVQLMLDQSGYASVVMHDQLGRLVSVLHQGELMRGSHLLHINADQLASGSYFITASTGNASQSQHLTVIR